MMGQWTTRPELQQFIEDAVMTRQQELEQLLQVRQSLSATGTTTGTVTGG
jgi:hypothetical protein